MALHLSKPNRIRKYGSKLAITAPVTISPYAGQSSATSLTITEYANQRVFQRKGTTLDIPVIGTYTGSPYAIQARVVDATTGNAITSWTTIALNPTGGTYLGALTGVPQGYWYKLQVRDGANVNITAAANNKFGIGMWVMMIGQSNMVNMPGGNLKYPLGHPASVEYDSASSSFKRIGNIKSGFPANTPYSTYGDGFTTEGNRGDAIVYIANTLVANLGIPVCLANKAVGGTQIASWMVGASNSNWTAVPTLLNSFEKDAELWLWLQGESDAATMSRATMVSYLGTLHTQIKNQVANAGRAANQVKFGIFSLGPGSYQGSVEGDFGKMRLAHLDYALNTAGAFLVTCCYDGKTADGVHMDGASFNPIGLRAAKSIAKQYGFGTASEGPKVSSASRSGTTVTVNITHSGGTALMDGTGNTSGTGIGGFQVYDNGVEMTPITGAITGPSTVTLTLPSTPTGPVTMSFGLMNAPCGTASTFVPAKAIYDNATDYMPVTSTLGMLLQPCAPITVS